MTRLSEAAEQAARATGLPKTTCMTLLEDGWTLVKDITGPTRWEEPPRYVNREDIARLELTA